MPDIAVSRAILTAPAGDLAEWLTRSCGPLVPLSAIYDVLGYRSADAARKAAARNRLEIEAVTLPGRRGKFVRCVELAGWIHKHQTAMEEQSELG